MNSTVVVLVVIIIIFTSNNRGHWNHFKITRTVYQKSTKLKKYKKEEYCALHTYYRRY